MKPLDVKANSLTISAALVNEPGAAFAIQSAELDAPRPNEILVRVGAVGICHTDLVTAQGHTSAPFPFVLGHEGAGDVVAVGSAVVKVRPGDRVVMTLRSCGDCPSCQCGQPSYCHAKAGLNYSGVRPDGSHTIHSNGKPVSASYFGQSSFATHAIAYERNVVKLPDELPFSVAAPLGCGVQTGAGAVFRSLDCRRGASLVVAGGGAVGLSAVLAARVRGCAPIIVIEPAPGRRRLALEFGAAHTIDPAQEPDLAAALRRILPAGLDYAIDTSGRTAVIEALVAALAPLGRLGVLGLPPDLSDTISIKVMGLLGGGLTIRGIVEGDSDPDVFIPELINLYQKGQFPFDAMIKAYPFARINEAVSDQSAGLCVKPVLLMEA
jgi:aryl-alcohol dehydrogenase